MRSLSDTLERLARLNRERQPYSPPSRFSELERFGSNPGALSAKVYLPSAPPEHPALVVVLHGCTQTAAGYDDASGWSRLADEFGFALLFPEQRRSNNANLCFNWFVPEDIRRDTGEALSIRQMIEMVSIQHKIDRSRVFITGLSAGGAMANVMLAAYPEVFAAGAIIAGLPYGTASTVPEAFDRMRGHGLPAARDLSMILAAASPTVHAWPTVSIWHGTADRTVAEANAQAVIDQWRGVHRLSARPSTVEVSGRDTTTIWRDSNGQVLISYHSISNLAHGTPLDTSNGREKTAPFMIDVGISSTSQIAHEWGLTPTFERRDIVADSIPSAAGKDHAAGIQTTIENALRAAGLMK